MKFKRINLTKKRKQDYLQVTFNKTDVSTDRQTFDASYIKTSNQPMTRKLSDAVDTLIPHLAFASERVDGTLKLNGELDYEKWFNDHDFKDDDRFKTISVTKVEFNGKEDYDSVKIHGEWYIENTAKPVKNKFFTGWIALDKTSENKYALSSLLCDHVDDLITLVDGWLEKVETTPNNQLSIAV